MWKKDKRESGAIGTKSLIKQTRKDLKMQGIEMNFQNEQDFSLYPPMHKKIQLQEPPSEFDAKVVQTSIELRDKMHKSLDYILFSKSIHSNKNDVPSNEFGSDELRKHLCTRYINSISNMPRELVRL